MKNWKRSIINNDIIFPIEKDGVICHRKETDLFIFDTDIMDTFTRLAHFDDRRPHLHVGLAISSAA